MYAIRSYYDRIPARVKLIDFSGLRTGGNRAAVSAVEVSQEFLTHSRVVRVKARVVNLADNEPISRLPIQLWTGKKNVITSYSIHYTKLYECYGRRRGDRQERPAPGALVFRLEPRRAQSAQYAHDHSA